MSKTNPNLPKTARQMGVYILKLDRPLGNDNHRAQYYVGWTVNLPARLSFHRKGRGAAFTRAAVEQGIGFEVVVWIPGATRELERSIKNYKNTPKWIAAYNNRLIKLTAKPEKRKANV